LTSPSFEFHFNVTMCKGGVFFLLFMFKDIDVCTFFVIYINMHTILYYILYNVIYAYMYAYAYIILCIYLYMYICIYICFYVCKYVYIIYYIIYYILYILHLICIFSLRVKHMPIFKIFFA
jgi:hypothetical protein